MVLRVSAAPFAAILLLAACGNNIRTKEKVQEAIINRLSTRSGLDLKSLDVTTTSVTFDKNVAYADVAFHPKGDTRVNSDMVMKYTLEDRDGKWVVVKVGDSQGHGVVGGTTGTGSGQLPPGHPPLDQPAPGTSSPGIANPHTTPTDKSGASGTNGQVR